MMKNEDLSGRGRKLPDVTAESVGLDAAAYRRALAYLFDRPVPQEQADEWFWSIDEPELDATPLEWIRIQTVLFANAGRDLVTFDDDQVGMGLNYLMSNGISDVPSAAVHESVPAEEALRMMAALPGLWQGCLGPRLGNGRTRIGSGQGRLGYVCYMWFDVWPTFPNATPSKEWRQALWEAFREMLEMPWRDVQVSALHGIGHHVHHLDQELVDATIENFVQRIGQDDNELKSYAQAARRGLVL